MEITLALTIEDLNILFAALGQVPLAQSLGTYQKIQQQASEQLNAQTADTGTVRQTGHETG